MHITQLSTGGHALSLRNDAYGRSAARRRQGIRMGEAQSRRGRRTPGRFKRGFGLGMSQHHGGTDGLSRRRRGVREAGGGARREHLQHANWMSAADGNVTMKIALPDSGSNAATALAHMVAEMLGFTTRDQSACSGATRTSRRRATNGSAAAPSRCKERPSAAPPTSCERICWRARRQSLKVDAAKLQIRDGVISSADDPQKSTTFAALAKANNGLIRQTGRGVAGGERTALEQRRGRVLRRSGSRHLDRRLALRSRRLHARHRARHQSAGVRSRHGRLA